MTRYLPSLASCSLLALLALGLLSACGGGAPSDTAETTPEEPLPSHLSELTGTADAAGDAGNADSVQQSAGTSSSNTSSGTPAQQSPGTSQETADTGTSSSDDRIIATGEFTAPVRSELVARRPGRIAAVLVDEGDAVRRGQALLRLETLYVEPERDRAAAQLRRAEANLKEAESDYGRKQELLTKGSVPQAVHDRSLAAFEQAQADVAVAQAALTVARQHLADSVLYAPFDGVVARRAVDPGEYLKDDTVALTLVQVDPLELRFQLAERYLPEVREGQHVETTVAPYPGRIFVGEIVRIRKVVDPDSRSFSVWARFPNPDGQLQPGLFARVEVARVEVARVEAAQDTTTESEDAQTR